MYSTHTHLFRISRVLLFFISAASYAQEASSDSLLSTATLDNVIGYALEHQPLVKQAIIDEEITHQIIKGKLADWYPQINFAFNYNRYIDLQSSVIGGSVIRFGVDNTSSAQFNATQNIFNRDVLLASSTASKVRIFADHNTSRSKIDVVVSVTKAFYDLLATQQQIQVTKESIIRLERSSHDAQSRYETGVSDKTDYKRATILLGNARANLKTNTELLKVKEQYLKSLMGYPAEHDLPIQYDTLQMENEIGLDTLQTFNVVNHIEYKMLFIQRELQDANVKHSQWAYLPTLTLFGNYNLNYQNNNLDELFRTQYPYSYIGATLALPIFQGGKRNAKIREQKWTRNRIDEGLVNLENTLRTEYTRALASYKSNLAQYLAQKENVALAREVYDIIQLQYQNGIKAYLDVTVAETDLQTTRINYFNALYQVLASKIDVQRALGQINY
ncbi:MAG TPA: TolC family protein [Cyclobacteriaceae bacterium]|nr:TolC family protein [Cyclobacteriaceae bacterium]